MDKTSITTWIFSFAVASALGLGLTTVAGETLHRARVASAIASGDLKVVQLERVVVAGQLPQSRIIKRTTLALKQQYSNVM